MLSEAKLNASYPEQLTTISTYQQIQRKRNSSGGWVPIYDRDSIKFKQRKDVPMSDLKLICLEVELLNSKRFIIIAWCRPPNSSVDLFAKLERVL